MTASARAIRSPADSRQGMTLVEALVALALLGMLAVAAVGLLPLMNRMADRSGALQRAAADLGRVHDFTRFLVTNALTPADLGAAGSDMPPLERDARHFDVLGPLPPGLGRGGLYRMALTVEGPAGHQALRLRVAPLRPDGPPPGDGVLVDGASRIAWSYFDAKAHAWTDHWTDAGRAPALVRLDVVLADEEAPWPPMIAAPVARGGVLCAYDPVQGGCRPGGPRCPPCPTA
ncbi:prepilin-type N-terminal cleavage/methylation domain-containing protein [Nitrospirillum sp. BR 11163]|uniref:prepilin-type N-terminal cleavage/methylation domain-containing protein n=1 Tax=Nitrospirillum sp. BR 11163 TaxID=3104323 RepID=UPI002AFE438D|nr:prepilin-type N-terminal cleavage/methylation domain-containing protein [Nitrospirillum sp. BR 11163]MEA1674773.1 prepilin-type N-terminal cleavage/methylation domain-containing protein [Nitrospirillum sp. BR 11163]